MKLVLANVVEVVFIGVSSVERTDKDGFTSVVNYLAVDSEGDVGKLPCTTEVLNSVKDIPKYSKIVVVLNLDTYKKEFVVGKVNLRKEKKSESTES